MCFGNTWIGSLPVEDHPLCDVYVFLEQGYFDSLGRYEMISSHMLLAGQISISVTLSQSILNWEGPTRIIKSNFPVNGPYGDWIHNLGVMRPCSKGGSVYRGQGSLQVPLWTSILIVQLLRSMSSYKERTTGFLLHSPIPLEYSWCGTLFPPSAYERTRKTLVPNYLMFTLVSRFMSTWNSTKNIYGDLARHTKLVLEQNEISLFYLSL